MLTRLRCLLWGHVPLLYDSRDATSGLFCHRCNKYMGKIADMERGI